MLPVLLACAAPTGAPDTGQAPKPTPTELGQVDFSRDFDASLARARRESKPVFLLFQEIPGCATCVAFGKGPLSHPLLVEAIEQLFVPVAVYNNCGGADGALLKRYLEPAWNNPVVRLLDADGVDLIERQDRVWSTGGIVARMNAALIASATERPGWFTLLAEELDPSARASAVFAMPCYWSGEARLGGLDGVLDTRAGWHAGQEVVEVAYNPQALSWNDLLSSARRAGCASSVWVRGSQPGADGTPALDGTLRAAKASDQLYYLERSALRLLPLTPLQARRINAALASKSPTDTWLSPHQLRIAGRMQQLDEAARARLAEWTRPTEHARLAHYTRDLEQAIGL